MFKAEDTSASGFILDEKSSVTPQFSDLEEQPSSGGYRFIKAKRFGRWWTLKGLQPALCDNDVQREMLREEFEALIALQHSGIAQGVSFEDVEGVGWCIVMEWVDGVTLREWLETPHPQKDRRRVARQLMDALDYVHAQGLAHGNLASSSIMVTRNGTRVKLIGLKPSSTAVRDDIHALGGVLEDLRLGCLYAPIVRRCKTLPHAYACIPDVQRAFRRVQSARHAVGVLAILILFVGGLMLSIGKTPPPDGRIYAVADSLRQSIGENEKVADSLELVIVGLSTELDTIRTELRNRADKERRIDAFIARTKAGMRKRMSELTVAHLTDSLHTAADVNRAYYAVALPFAKFTSAIVVPDSLNLTAVELVSMRLLISAYNSKLMRALEKRIF